jgi:hypothetical protein
MNEEHEFSSFVAEHLADVNAASSEGLNDFDSLVKLNPNVIDLHSVSDQKELVTACIDYSLYQFNTDNMIFIAQVLGGKGKENNTDAKTKNLSTLRASKNQKVIEHIDFFISDYLEQVIFKLPDNSDEELSTLIYIANHKEISDELKKAFLKQQSLKIPTASDFPENLWEYLLELDMLIHTWKNITHCLNSESVSQTSLAEYVSMDSVIDALLATGKPTKFIEDTEFVELENFIVSHVGPKGEAYQRLLGIVDGKYDSVSSADIHRLEALLTSDILAFTPENISAVSGNPKLYAKLIANNLDEFSVTPAESAPNADAFEALFKHKFTDAQLQLVLSKIPDSIITDDTPVTKSMASAISSMKDISSVNDEHLLLSISNLKDVDDKLTLFSRAIDRFDEVTVMNLWRELPEPYCNVGIYGNRPRIPKTQATESLLQRMSDSGMVSNVKEEHGELRISTFKSSEHD